MGPSRPSRGKEITYMKTFTIDTDNTIIAFANADEAAATAHESFSNQKELAARAAKWPEERLVAIWNSLAGVEPVKQFKSAHLATGQIWERIQGLGEAEKPRAIRRPKRGAQAATGAPAKRKASKQAPSAQRAAKGRKAP